MRSAKSLRRRSIKGMRSGSNFRMLTIRSKKALMYSHSHRRKHSIFFGKFFVKTISLRQKQLFSNYSMLSNLIRNRGLLLDRKVLFELSKKENLVHNRLVSFLNN
jgi:ribosomal protein L20